MNKTYYYLSRNLQRPVQKQFILKPFTLGILLIGTYLTYNKYLIPGIKLCINILFF